MAQQSGDSSRPALHEKAIRRIGRRPVRQRRARDHRRLGFRAFGVKEQKLRTSRQPPSQRRLVLPFAALVPQVRRGAVETRVEYLPMQPPASFNLNAVKAQVEEMIKQHVGQYR